MMVQWVVYYLSMLNMEAWKIWYVISLQYLQIFQKGRAPEICLSSTLFKTTEERDIFGTTFSWNVKSAKLKRILSGSASSLSKYYSIQQVKDCFEERKLIRTQSMTRQQQSDWYNMLLDILIRHSLRLHWTLTRHERMWEISGHSIVMDRYFQVSWCPYKYVFLSNLGQKWTFSVSVLKRYICSQSGGVVGLRLGTKCNSLSVTGGRIASCNSKALMKISPSKNPLFSLYQRGREVEKL